MDYNKISLLVAESVQDIVYLSDIETYELYYINKRAIDEFSKANPNFSWQGKKCYEVLQNKTEPCDFCTNKHLTLQAHYNWSYFNPITNRHYSLKDKLVEVDGNLIRLEIATDTTNQFLLNQDLNKKLIEQKTLTSCIQTLHTTSDTQSSILELLEILGKYYNAQRCYIFTISPDKKFLSNEFEWTDGIALPSKEDLTNVEITPFKRWIEVFRYCDELIISNAQNENLPIEELELLNKYTTENLIAVPLKDFNGDLFGFIGVDNPKHFKKETMIFKDLSLFISNFFDKNMLLSNLNRLSFYDTFTGIKNRNSYLDFMQGISASVPKSMGVAVLDIKSLKIINETQGHKKGDKVILKLCSILKNHFGENVFRLGGDEFVALSMNLTECEFEDLISSFQIDIKSQDFDINLGFAYNKTYENFDLAEDLSKSLKTGAYSKILLKNLQEELKNDKFTVYFQPQICLKTDKIVGAEALIRKYDSKKNIKPPFTFLPFYEKESMISYIDFYVFETVCKFLNNIQKDTSTENFRISINFSRSSLTEAGMVGRLINLCNYYHVLPKNFVIEVTETVSGIDDIHLISLINEFNDAGFLVSLDDFGAGYSNLSIITKARFDEIKIDKTIIDTLQTNEKSKTLAKWAVDLCKSLPNVESVAEGIETEYQYNQLKEIGCDIGQGYYFAKPMSMQEFKNKYILN